MSTDKPLLSAYEDTEKDQSKFMKLLLFLLGAVCVISIAVFVYALLLNHSTSKTEKRADFINTIDGFRTNLQNLSLPTRFVVDNAYILPPTDQGNRGDCWNFATMYLLESQYRAQGIERGYLKPEEYVSFSKQAYPAYLHAECMKNTSVKACHYGGLLKNQSEDQQIESIYYFNKAFPGLKKSILPVAVCPYRLLPKNASGWDNFTCPGMETALEQNPVEFEVESIATAYDTVGVKQLLVHAKRALGIGFPIPKLVYYGSCNKTIFANTDDCVKQLHPCDGGYCHRIEYMDASPDGHFLANDDLSKMSEEGGHAMNIVGFNDGYVYRNRFMDSDTLAATKGAFILHNSWTNERGHSVEYFMGLNSEENENVICPNHHSPLNWIPGDLDCIQNNKGDVTKCPTSLSRVRGMGIVNTPDLLVCKNEAYCNKNFKYVLAMKDADVNTQPLPSGLSTTELIVIEDENTIHTEKVENFPFWALYNMLSPANPVNNSADSCGYFALPYKTLENARMKNWDLLDNFRVFDMKVNFANHSYARYQRPSANNYNTTLLQASTFTKHQVEFDGPLPYKYVY